MQVDDPLDGSGSGTGSDTAQEIASHEHRRSDSDSAVLLQPQLHGSTSMDSILSASSSIGDLCSSSSSSSINSSSSGSSVDESARIQSLTTTGDENTPKKHMSRAQEEEILGQIQFKVVNQVGSDLLFEISLIDVSAFLCVYLKRTRQTSR